MDPPYEGLGVSFWDVGGDGDFFTSEVGVHGSYGLGGEYPLLDGS